MSEQTLKDLLKPPLKTINFEYQLLVFDGNNENILENAGPVAIMGKNKLREELSDWITAALNEKWERDFGEPMRWRVEGDEFNVDPYFVCPNCNEEPWMYWDGESIDDLSKFNYCPHCGKRLLPPEEYNNKVTEAQTE
jgi:hypothetical protein